MGFPSCFGGLSLVLALLLQEPASGFTTLPWLPRKATFQLSAVAQETSALKVEDPSLLRNVGIVGHSHHGKSTLMEWMLYDENVLTKTPTRAHSSLDADPAEAQRGSSVFSHYGKCPHNGHVLALTDTPWGDFPADAQASVDGTDAAVLVVSAADSVQSGTLSAWQHCASHHIPAMVALTKLDRPFLQLSRVLQDMEDAFGIKPLPLQVLSGEPDDYSVLPLFQLQDDSGDLIQNAQVANNEELQLAWTVLEEAVAMTDDDLLVDYLEDGELTTGQVVRGLQKAVLQHKILPLVYTSAESDTGVRELMDIVVGVLPSPLDTRDEAIRMACEQEAAKCDLKPGIEAGFCARVLHTTINSFGSLSVLRVISNSVHDTNDAFASLPHEVVNLRNEETIKMPSVATSFSLSGKDRVSLQDGMAIVPGDVIAVPKLPESVHTNDILSIPEAQDDELSEILLETQANVLTPLSRPVEQVALMTAATVTFASGDTSSSKQSKKKKGGNKNNNNDEKLVNALRSLAREDLALRLEQDAASGKLMVHCMSAEHLQLLALRLEDRYDLHVEFGQPPVAYRETLVKRVVKVEGKHKKQSGGSGQFGVCFIDMEPLEEGAGIEFESRIKGGVISKTFIASVEKGVREQLQAGGPLGGFPVTDVKVTLVDGKMHSVDSKDIAFQSAGKQAVKAALERGKTRLLQPMEKVTFSIDTSLQGDVNSIVSRFDGYVLSSTPGEVGSELEMEAILCSASIGQVSDSLRAASAGEGSFTSEFSHYQPVQDDLVKGIVGESHDD
ncbi:factor G [Seminavis robusta]|uniref:Factor G n=1 Tax=Seminavis robusta TaxID=568900 RepID=A0A9N8D9V0_9STRA|nr:factor G [Seminavis robusta]|eukprot:Sro27_g018430.1 factor G (784) ;mRNA; f:154357-156860